MPCLWVAGGDDVVPGKEWTVALLKWRGGRCVLRVSRAPVSFMFAAFCLILSRLDLGVVRKKNSPRDREHARVVDERDEDHREHGEAEVLTVVN